MHIYRWDLDRTYLETEIHSVRGLVRAAFETASEKRTVPGAAALIRALQANDPEARVAILSGSPVQMREVLSEKLALDGVRVDQLTLKDNLGNIKRGRLSAVRGQIGFKLPYLLEHRLSEQRETKETLFGDDSETDALVYSSYAALLAEEIDLDMIVAILKAGNAYPDAIERAVAAGRALQRADAVCDIFIRIDRGIPVGLYRVLGPRVIPVFSWFQAALVLFKRDRLSAASVAQVRAASSSSLDATIAWILDAVRRGLIDRDLVEVLLAADLLTPSGPIEDPTLQIRRMLDRLGPLAQPVAPERLSRPDFLGFLRGIQR